MTITPQHEASATVNIAVAEARGRTRKKGGRGRRNFLFKRLGFYLAAAWAAITLNFVIPRLMPGDPSAAIIDQLERVSGQALAPSTLVSIQGLFGDPDQNLFEQYIVYLGQLARFDLGVSIVNFPVPVASLVATGLPWTLMLVGVTTVAAFVIGTSLGVATGWRAGSRFDSIVTPLTTFLSSVPYFWVALLAVWYFGFILGWFPLSGGYDPNLPIAFSFPFALSALQYGALPAATIVFSAFGGWMLGMRNMTVTTVGEDYVLLAQAKGLSPARVRWRYAARNAMLPQFTGFAMALGGVVGGALLTEIVFSYPGIGYLLFSALQKRDYPVMQGVFLLVTLTVLLANLIADSVYVWLDPRVREEN
ncbi:peptide/nickel transport system permease protein [Microbacterium endophyticum]|uniref:Peptide/nickel transport system permease protein n=1 Tax=Microbacterium endophyticum TaxID=1526412 RepID=A0A7W4YMW8_9MICO|nr:ABC transporter permease [Microbacterium endophyticum]MBB2976613.1 peptide/nickel transport system permease protein [Microbacterium endophyticum]NIK37504.1 peptide/nickel transport system permease protein [Microbacterium endophyticum]